jgi:hypothetical protein
MPAAKVPAFIASLGDDGFRSTLSTWAEEQDDYPQPVIKFVLAHGKGDAVTMVYLRSDLCEARRKLMEAWSAFAMGDQSS